MDNLYDQILNDLLAGTFPRLVVEKYKSEEISEEKIRAIIAEIKPLYKVVEAVFEVRQYEYSHEQIEKSMRKVSKDEEFINKVIDSEKQWETNRVMKFTSVDKEDSVLSQAFEAGSLAVSLDDPSDR